MIFLFQASLIFSQVNETERRHCRIGSLQSHFSAYGSERAWNNTYYEGLIWPADYPYNDNSVIKRSWIAVRDFTDAEDYHWDYWATYMSMGYVKLSLYPVKLKQTAKFAAPTVFIDGNNITAPYAGDVDAINPNQIPDRIIENVVNTSIGLTMIRRIHAFSQQYHDNYFIKEFVFINTGFINYDSVVVLTDTLKGVRIGWGTRYQCGREVGYSTDGHQTWGKHSWVTVRGEEYPEHYSDQLTESTPIEELHNGPIRCGFEWFGQSERRTYDCIGGPYLTRDGRLTAIQHVGTAILHVDKSINDRSDDPYQPTVLGWHVGDEYPRVGELTHSEMINMGKVYTYLSGEPSGGDKNGGSIHSGNGRMDEIYEGEITDRVDPYTVHGDGSGTNVWICYGPFDIPPGDSIKIVEVEAVDGISRTMCEQIGRRWKLAYDNPGDTGPFDLPDGTTTSDKNFYKNSWVYTGKDSILLTFSRAKRNYESGFQIPQPPLPPPIFEVNSGGDRISLSWSPSLSEFEPDFVGYEIYRAVGKPDTTYERIGSVLKDETSYDDLTPVRGFSYYYYIVSVNDGSYNTDGITNPTGPLHSGRFYTKTNEPAYLRRKAGKSLKDICVVPNPYNIKAERYQYTGEPDKIMFLNIPAQCEIRIFTERGDLIETIKHTDGSGDETWNSITSSRQVVVSGVYIAYFEITKDYYDPVSNELLYRKGENAIRKFIIIR